MQGLDSVPPEDRPTIRETNIVHLCWDIMVGLGTLLFLLAVWYALSWIFAVGCRRPNGFSGRQPWPAPLR